MKQRLIAGSISIFLFGLVFFLAYSGFFHSITVQEKNVGPYIFVYEEHIGNYKGTAKVQNKIYYSLLNDYNIETFKGFGIYYDNPQNVPEEELRSIAGSILEEVDYNKSLKLVEQGFQIDQFEEQQAIVVEFPYRNSLSIMAGLMKVYPKINRYLLKNGFKSREIMEIYDIPGKKILYIIPLHDSND